MVHIGFESRNNEDEPPTISYILMGVKLFLNQPDRL